MIRAVIFDMFETLVTHYNHPLFFGPQMAKYAGIPIEKFLELWRSTEYDRNVGNKTLQEVLETILRENHCYSEKLLRDIVEKRIATKKECFIHLHPEIIPMLSMLKEKSVLVGLISNSLSEEVEAIRESILFPYFDAVYLSYEQGIQKPNKQIFKRCMERFSAKPDECLYVGDGGCYELETAKKLGMTVIQAVWYINERTPQMTMTKVSIPQAKVPLDVINYL